MHKIDYVQGMKINSISKDHLFDLLKNDINQNVLKSIKTNYNME